MQILKKREIAEAAIEFVMHRLAETEALMASINADIASDTKSSMGDKYETSREMATAELNKAQKVKQTLLENLSLLKSAAVATKGEKTGLGSLLVTDRALFFLGAPLGKLKIENQDIFFISIDSPLGKKLNGISKDMAFVEFNHTRYVIKEIQ